MRLVATERLSQGLQTVRETQDPLTRGFLSEAIGKTLMCICIGTRRWGRGGGGGSSLRGGSASRTKSKLKFKLKLKLGWIRLRLVANPLGYLFPLTILGVSMTAYCDSFERRDSIAEQVLEEDCQSCNEESLHSP
jgi:hypothetical protein